MDTDAHSCVWAAIHFVANIQSPPAAMHGGMPQVLSTVQIHSRIWIDFPKAENAHQPESTLLIDGIRRVTNTPLKNPAYICTIQWARHSCYQFMRFQTFGQSRPSSEIIPLLLATVHRLSLLGKRFEPLQAVLGAQDGLVALSLKVECGFRVHLLALVDRKLGRSYRQRTCERCKQTDREKGGKTWKKRKTSQLLDPAIHFCRFRPLERNRSLVLEGVLVVIKSHVLLRCPAGVHVVSSIYAFSSPS